MSVLEKIRSRSGLLVGIIAVALLVFILESALESGNRFFGSNRTKVGEIAGKEISIQEFEAKVEEAVSAEKQRSQRNSIDESTMDNIRTQVWNQFLIDNVLKTKYEELGVAVSDDELFDMVQGKNPHPSVKQAFTNPQTGVFDPAQVITFLKNMDKDETGDTKRRWLQFESAIKEERVANKFNTMVKKGLYLTKAEVNRDNAAKNRYMEFTYVFKPYASQPDSLFKVSEDDLKKVYNETKNKYKQSTESREIDFVYFDIQPSNEDRSEAQGQIKNLIPEFQASTNDSDFVNANADTKYTEKFFGRTDLNPVLDTLLRANVGTIIGPYNEGNIIKISKLSGVKMMPDSVKARHILIKIENGNSKAANSKADSLKKLIKAGQKFEDLAKTFSTDQGSAVKGGDLGYFRSGMMVKPFNDACFNGKVGDMPIVESQFGVHLIEITGRGAETRKLIISTIDRELAPSTKTMQDVYAKASSFAGQNTTKEAFDAAAKKDNLNKMQAANIDPLARQVSMLNNARALVRWVYEAKKGDVSKVIDVDGRYVIAVLTSVREKGISPLDAVRNLVEMEAIKEKKAEKFLAEISSKAGSASSIEQYAQAMGLPIDTARNITFAGPYIPKSGRELELVGKLSVSKSGTLVKPMKGENGVVVAQLNKLTEAPAVTDYKQAAMQISQQMSGRVDYEMFEALKEKANVEDNRANFY
jgi:peptidyl-prolyl cis-trans isomerase D